MDQEAVPGVLGAGAPFLGQHNPKLDDKGRLILPAKFRPQLAEGLVMTKGQEHCLYLLPADVFARMHQHLSSAPVTSKPVRDYLRVLLSGAEPQVPDRQGRVSIPQHLRAYAGLVRDVTVVGMGTRVEVWDAPTWEAYLEQAEPVYADTTEEVFPPSGF